MFFEWGGRTVKTDAYFRGNYQVKKGDVLYYPYIKKEKLSFQKMIVEFIEYDTNAPKINFFGAKKLVEVPLYLCSKDINEARNIFIKYSKNLKQIKLRSKKNEPANRNKKKSI